MDTRRTILQKLGGTLNIAWYAVHLFYLIIRLIPGFGYTTEQFQSLHYAVLLNALLPVCFLNALATQLGALYKAEELAALGNQLLYFNRLHGEC